MLIQASSFILASTVSKPKFTEKQKAKKEKSFNK